MDLKYEFEMQALHKYLERVYEGQVTGAEPFHVIVNLMGQSSDLALADARSALVADRKKTVKAGEPFPMIFENLISGASSEGLLEVSKILAEDRLVLLGCIEDHEQCIAAEAFHEKYAGRGHLRPVR